MDYLYTLYDALVSINVPTDMARAVISAMERDMGTTIATKTDLQLLATKAELQLLQQSMMAELHLLQQSTKADLHLLRQELTAEIVAVKDDVAELRTDVALIRKDMAHLATTMTVRTGSMVMFGMGLLFAALKLT